MLAKHVVLATGSNARAAAGRGLRRGELILSNDGALRIGCRAQEAGCDRLRRDRPGNGLGLASPGRRSDGARSACRPSSAAVDESVAKEAAKLFKKQGLKIELGVKISEVKPTSKGGVSVAYTDAKGAEQKLWTWTS